MPYIPRTRDAFTAIELIVVVGIIIVLTALALPTLSHSIQQGRISEAAGMIRITANEARSLALSNTRREEQMTFNASSGQPAAPMIPFGVQIRRHGAQLDDLGRPLPAHAVLVGWSRPSGGAALSEPVELAERRYFNPNIDLFWLDDPAAMEKLVVFSYRIGSPGSWSTATGINILEDPEIFIVGSLDTEIAADDTVTRGFTARFTIYPRVGLIHVK